MRLIDAAPMLEQLDLEHYDKDWYVSQYNADWISSWLESQPVIEAEPVKHGQWNAANDGTHFCSECGCDASYTWDDIDRFFINSADDVPDRISNYCPNCGAKMDLEGEG